jgi:hypothetical protein
MVNPRQPAEARSSTAHTSDRQECSPGSRPITLTRRRVSPKVRSMKLECRTRVQCSRGNRRSIDEFRHPDRRLMLLAPSATPAQIAGIISSANGRPPTPWHIVRSGAALKLAGTEDYRQALVNATITADEPAPNPGHAADRQAAVV